jgi:hypothetical protein
VSTPTFTNPSAFDEVIDAMRSIQTEGDRWHLAESLAVLVPSGVSGFGDVIDKASKEGVVGKLSVTTLRLYRDTALRWPADKRVPNVGFSAHREAIRNIDNATEAARILRDVAKTQGASKVTVSAVRKAVAIKQGKAVATAPKPTATATKAVDVLRDLENGGSDLIAAISGGTDADTLDKLHSGLTKAIAHVERLRAKATQKAAAAKGKAQGTPRESAAAKPAAKKAAATSKAQGDLRGL